MDLFGPIGVRAGFCPVCQCLPLQRELQIVALGAGLSNSAMIYLKKVMTFATHRWTIGHNPVHSNKTKVIQSYSVALRVPERRVTRPSGLLRAAPYSGSTIAVPRNHNLRVAFSSRKRHLSRFWQGHVNCGSALQGVGIMHDILVALAFVAMVASPAIFASIQKPKTDDDV
jgi:hypothetical protein